MENEFAAMAKPFEVSVSVYVYAPTYDIIRVKKRNIIGLYESRLYNECAAC